MDDLISRQMAIDALKQQAETMSEWSNRYAEQKKGVLTAVNIVEDLPSAQRWIPCSERLPDENEAVNIVWVNRSPAIYYQDIKDKPQSATGVYYNGNWYWWSAVVQDYLTEYGECDCDKMDEEIEVTHWMPLPEPPKEKN